MPLLYFVTREAAQARADEMAAWLLASGFTDVAPPAPQPVGDEWALDVSGPVFASVTPEEADSRWEPVHVQRARLVDDAEAAIDALLDGVAIGWGYKDGDRLARYINSANLTWKAEAEAFLAHADACWLKAQQIQEEALATGDIPTVAQVLARMPTVTRPT